jgi:replicative DNA helicase
MAVLDDRWAAPAPAPAPAEPSRQFDRQPPQDLAAEQSVLGGMLLSKDAIADVVEELSATDFYKPAHALVYEVILNLYARGEPADVVTVAAELDKAGSLSRMGGAVYLHTLTGAVPTAANAAFYAQIVAEKAVLRRLVEAGTRIVQLGYGGNEGQVGGGEVDEIVDRAQAEIYDVTERRTTEDYVVLEELLQPTMDEMDAIASRGGMSAGVPTGFADLDALTNGFHPGQMIIMAARPGVGKALALDTPLPTPTGWTTMGSVQVDDLLLGADGHPVRVVAATEVLHGRPCYSVEFSDGEAIVADAQHQWVVGDRVHENGDFECRTSSELAAGLSAGREFAVPVAAPLVTGGGRLPTDPWVVGYLLNNGHFQNAGDGGSCRVSCREQDRDWVMKEFDRLGYAVSTASQPGLFLVTGTADRWRSLGLDRDGRIPNEYLRGSIEQRLSLVQGLVDSGGTVDDRGRYVFSSNKPALLDLFLELTATLGATSRVLAQASGDSQGPASLQVQVASTHVFARMPRKMVAAETTFSSEFVGRYIAAVRPVEPVAVRCVQVDNADHLYLAGRRMVPTHNSTLALDVARNASVKHRLTSVIFSLEMSKTEITMRLLSAEAQIRLSQMRAGTMSEQDWQKIVRRMSEISDAPLFIDDSPNMTMMEIRAKARRLKQRNNLKLIVLDYLQLMSSGKKVESRQQEVSEFSRQMKLLAKELEVPVIAISQLNRGPEQRTDKRPMLSDLRESGSLEQDADMVILVHRPDAFEADDPRAGEADLIIAKHRNGPTATISVAHQLHYSRFTDLAAQ